MQQIRYVISLLLSLSLHVALVFEAQRWSVPSVPKEPEPIVIALGEGFGPLAPAAPETAPPEPAAPAPKAIEPAPPKPVARVIPPPRPRVVAPPKAPPAPRSRPQPKPATVEGVRLATAADIRARRERERSRRQAPLREEAPAPPAVPAPPAPVPAAPAPPPEPEPPSEPSVASADGEDDEAQARPRSEPKAQIFWRNGVLYQQRVFTPRGGASPDAPGYEGQIFGEVPELDREDHSRSYGRLHLFQDDGVSRDYSGKSLFGYVFRQELGGGALRQFETGRVQTHGAYLMVTDLFSNGRLSTMSHTVILAFPRKPPGATHLYDVLEEGRQSFRLRAPNGASLVFDPQTRALRATSGFVIAPPGDAGTPPRVAYKGLHVRIEAVGKNPFLRDRPATVVDARGAECAISTSDLFSYGRRRRESDMFRYATDREFFSFLGNRCPELSLPRPAEPRAVARAPEAPSKEPEEEGDGGLFGALVGRPSRKSR